jgi:FkbM family methyltransferase
MSTALAGTFFAALQALFNRGVRYSTVIDIGCADGHFFLNLRTLGFAPDAVPLNIDPNPIYESSLRTIKDVVGGDYRVCAISDREGQLELNTGAHPYWASLRPAGNAYWRKINDLSGSKALVHATTLDSLAAQLGLSAPFLLKLDVQGAEESVLNGAAEVLKKTHVVICEADMEDFQDLNAALVKRGFFLYDLTELSRIADGTLGWFYPVYVNCALDFVRPNKFWAPQDNAAVIRVQEDRRKAILKWNAEALERIRRAVKISN